MRHLILIAAALMMSASAQAGQTRGLVMASNDAVETAQPAPAAKSPTQAETPAEVKPDTAKVSAKEDVKEEAKAPAAKSRAPVVRKRESDEQKARRIAARYGISW